MKIKIYKYTQGEEEKIFEGKYEYLEGGKTEGKPSFHIVASNEKEDCEIYFYCESEEEIKGLIEELKRFSSETR